jgi:hypothetical protein
MYEENLPQLQAERVIEEEDLSDYGIQEILEIAELAYDDKQRAREFAANIYAARLKAKANGR